MLLLVFATILSLKNDKNLRFCSYFCQKREVASFANGNSRVPAMQDRQLDVGHDVVQ